MRLLGVVALCVILLTALVFGYERRHEITNHLTESVENLLPRDFAVIDAPAAGLEPENLTAGLATIAMREGGTLTTLTSFPDFARARFDMPTSVLARSGEILLEIAGELNEGAEGVLRISVNGVRRTALALDEGRIQRKLVMPLNTRELASDQLTVSLSIEGRTPQVACTAEWNGGVALQVLPSSHLKLQLNDVVTDPLDKLLLAGAPTRLIWPSQTVVDQAKTLGLAHRLHQNDRDLLFVEAQSGEFALTSDDIAALDAQLPDFEAGIDREYTDLAAGLGQRRAQTFERETRFRMPFDLATLDGQVKALDLEMQYASAEQNDASWLISVFLNDRLVHAEGTSAHTGVFQQRIALPNSYLASENFVTVTMQSGAEHQNLCATGVPSVVDVRRADLVLDEKTDQAAATRNLRAALSGKVALLVPSAVSTYDAQIAFETLKGLSALGFDMQFSAGDETAETRVSVITPDKLPSVLTEAGESVSWLVYLAREDNNRLVVVSKTEAAKLPIRHMPRSLLLVTSRVAKGA
ncbi:cellulose biosynthesis cyclic di-GMP-binding regulatory protein BcsB [Epibacterium ulvae]|uniref:cellulose biosynthesis cyclic di-GMP-binding regulatory protein BcsB n=1 Tax=Epibacterium ulvae TaxID=1156985 RepID=UPI002490B51E|nr:cellulose biosynthesis cyclic di-GMP-binding regulatory protein BcsB [Epibacterium ulvae]